VGTLTLFSSEIANEKTRLALRLAMLLIPILLAFLHPKVFRPVVNFILKKLRRPLIERQMSGRRLFAFLVLAIVDQFWLALGIWVATHSVLNVPLRDTWLLAGAYCLAWSAGFCMASIAPSGVGIREVVLSGTLSLLLGSRTGIELDAAGRTAIFAAIALLLRLWATSGELIFAVVAHFWDHKGARGQITQRAVPVGADPELAALPRREAAE
jgi:hypothetical protein